MTNGLKITIDVIIHATEDDSKFVRIFDEYFGLNEFTRTATSGYYNNPIIILGTELKRDEAQNFLDRLQKMLTVPQKNIIIDEIEQRITDSKIYLRFGKQEFLNGELNLKEDDAIKIKIHTPIYNKKNAKETFRKMFAN